MARAKFPTVGEIPPGTERALRDFLDPIKLIVRYLSGQSGQAAQQAVIQEEFAAMEARVAKLEQRVKELEA